MGSLEALQDLHRDLVAFTESKLPNLQRLSDELDAHLASLRVLLAKPSRSEASRKALQSGKVELNRETYALNEEFRNAALQVADEIDVDEIFAAKLFLEAQDEAVQLDRSPEVVSILRYHRGRQLIADCLRLVTQKAVSDTELESEYIDQLRQDFNNVIRHVVDWKEGEAANGSGYWQRCLGFMDDIERWLQRISDQLQRFSMTGQALSHEQLELMAFQQQSLMLQHEALAGALSYMIRGGYTGPGDLVRLVHKCRRVDKYDRILLHYATILVTAITHFGADDGLCSLEEARDIHQTMTSSKEADEWHLRNFHAAARAWWISEYSARFGEHDTTTARTSAVTNDAKLPDSYSSDFLVALNDGALHLTLSIARDMNRREWQDAAKDALVGFLLGEASPHPAEFGIPSDSIHELLCRGLQAFTEALITNMPSTIRQLRSDEDVSRMSMRGRFQRENQDAELHLERFLLIAAYAFEHDAVAASSFWTDLESNLYGFLQWAARRQTTPRVAAFCELIRALSDDEDCADAVHRFLLDDSQTVAGKFRRTGSLSWSQIISELQFYASQSGEQLAVAKLSLQNPHQATLDETAEPESTMMLECYLRLIAHICTRSSKARDWVLQNPSVSFHHLLLQLCSVQSDHRLRSCVFDTLNAICTQKSSDTFNTYWTALDMWLYGHQSSTVSTPAAIAGRADKAPIKANANFAKLAVGFEEPVAFVKLITVLLSPLPGHDALNDRLPFAESLGSAYRMPGIDKYVDLIMGSIFADGLEHLEDPVQVPLLRLACLSFAKSCLSSFNDDLVVIANQSDVDVDTVISTSSLSAYVLLHPFGRVMEWLFNDRVLRALFSSARQSTDKVSEADTSSPLVQSLLASIQVITLVLKLQATYLDVVRPRIREKTAGQRQPVANAALASFEDAILDNISIVVDLGLYCGTNHLDLIVASLQLLQTISASRRLVSSSTMSGHFRSKPSQSKVIAVLERDNAAQQISRAFVASLDVDPLELEDGTNAPGVMIKQHILEFLLECLTSLTDRPTIAHLLLGFSSRNNALEIEPNGLFSQGQSLFHAILNLSIGLPDDDGQVLVQWTGSIKALCTQILQTLWISPLSASLVIEEITEKEYVFVLAIAQTNIDNHSLWDGRALQDPEFLITPSISTYRDALRRRAAYFDLIARLLRDSDLRGMHTLRNRLERLLDGSATLSGTGDLPCPSIFDLFDFMELEVTAQPQAPVLNILGHFDFAICRVTAKLEESPFDLDRVHELLMLRMAERRQAGALSTAELEAEAQEEIRQALLYVHARNEFQETWIVQRQSSKAWIQAVTIALRCCKFEQIERGSFVLAALQVILPKYERHLTLDGILAVELATLALTLLKNLDLSAGLARGAKASDFAGNRLLQLFKISLAASSNYDAPPKLRNLNYQLCYRYLHLCVGQTLKDSSLSRAVLQAIKLQGDGLLDTMCDDAISAEGTCRISTLFLLEAMLTLTSLEKSTYIVEAFIRVNFITILLDGIEGMADDLRNASGADIPLLLAYYNAMLALLLRVARTKAGAAVLYNAGFVAAVRGSLLFSIDPDIGLDLETAEALKKFFDLMLAVLRVMNAMVVSRGQQHQKTLKQIRDFLSDSRPSVVGIFKRHASIGRDAREQGEDLADLVDNLTLLIYAADFLDHEDEAVMVQSTPGTFS